MLQGFTKYCVRLKINISSTVNHRAMRHVKNVYFQIFLQSKMLIFIQYVSKNLDTKNEKKITSKNYDYGENLE